VSRTAVATRVLPVAAIAAVLLLSWIAGGRVAINARLLASCPGGYGSSYGYTGGPPSVSDVNWALGPSIGGTTVTITGVGFCQPATSVTFGVTPATSFAINNDTSITATSPAGTLGSVVDVHVVSAKGISTANPGDRFGYIKSAVYTMDGYGGFHPDDSAAVSGTQPSYWAGFKIARAAHAWPSAGATQQGFTLDGYGGLHAYGPTVPAFSETGGSSGHYWNGFDIARDFAFMPDGSGGVVLDGFGGLHPFSINSGTAPTVSGYSYFGFDVAIKVVIAADGKGGFTLDAYGGVHPFSLNGNTAPAAVQNTGYWTSRLAADIALIPGQAGGYSGYVLDKFGGTHPFIAVGSTLPAQPATSYFGFNIARGIFFLSNNSTDGYTLDGYGGPHPFGNAPKLHTYPYWSGWDIAVTIFGA
jgi:IPT/TIG domain